MPGKLSTIEQHPSSWTLETEVVQACPKHVVLLAQPKGWDYRHGTPHPAEPRPQGSLGQPLKNNLGNTWIPSPVENFKGFLHNPKLGPGSQ